MPQVLTALFVQLASVIGGALNGVLGTAVSLMQGGTKAAMKFHQEGIALGRDLGLSLNQANAYTKVLTERTQELAAKYGVTSEAIMKVQRNISETTGKQLILNDAQAEGFVQANKLVGEQTTNKFIETIMNGMGGQINAVQGAISKAYATAAKQGLNAQKFSKTVADNLTMANRLNFRNGIDGITRMAAMAEKFGLNMKSVETAAGQFMELDSAIEHSAHLQMLGGSIGASFGNPLTNAYEAMYDPEALAKRMEDAMKGMATFDTQKGYATMSGINQDILRNYAKEMGLNAEEVVANAKKMAEVKYKENKFSSKLGGLNLSEDQRNFLINNGQVSEGGNELLFNGQNVNNMNPAELKKQLDNMMQFEGKSDTDILKEQAISLKSIDEALTGNKESIGAAFAKGLALDENAQRIVQSIDSYGKNIQNVAENLGKGMNNTLNGILDWLKEHKDTLKSIANGVIKVSKFLSDHWQAALAAWLGWKALGGILNVGLGNGTTIGSKLGAKAASGLGNIGQRMYKGSPAHGFLNDYYLRRGVTIQGGPQSWWRASLGAAKTSWKNSSRFAKGTAILGAVGAVSQGVMAQMDYKNNLAAIENGEWDRSKYKTKEEAKIGAENERNSGVGGAVGMGLGTAIGTFFGGPVGGMIAGAIGESIGKFVGGNWNKITSYISKGWDKVTRWFTSVDWGKVGETLISVFLPPVGAIIQVVKHWDEISAWFGEKWDGAMTKLSGLWKGIQDGWNSYVVEPFKTYIIKPIQDSIKWLDENIWQPVKNFFSKIKEGWDKLMGGIQKFLDDPWGAIKQGAKNKYDEAKDWAKGKFNDAKAWAKETFKFEDGGVVGGNSYSGDRIKIGVNSNEVIFNPKQFAQIFSYISSTSDVLKKLGSSNGVTYYTASNAFSSNYDTSRVSSYENNSIRQKYTSIRSNESYNTLSNILSTIFNSNSNVVSTALNTNSNIKTVPFGENSFRRIPKDVAAYNGQSVSDVNVKDFNVNLNGTLKLDGGNSMKNIDINQLLSDTSFVMQLKDLIKQSINNDINNGRLMNDVAYMRGMPSPSTILGRR